MKTTIEISDDVFRKAKATASLRGQTLKSFFTEAIQEKLETEASSSEKETGWRKYFGKASTGEAAKIQAVINEEFSKVNEEDWK